MTDNALDLFANQVVLGDDLCDSSGGNKFPRLSQGKTPLFRGTDDSVKALDGDEIIEGVYLAHRFSFVGYPVGYNGAKGDAEQIAPVFTGAAPANGPLADVVKTAASACQFCPGAKRDRFDVTEDNPAGHVKVSLEILIYNAEVDGPVVLRSGNHYKGVYPGDRSLGKLYRFKKNGSIGATAIAFKGVESPGYKQPLRWIDSAGLPEGHAIGDAWASFKAGVTEDMFQDIDDWSKCLDNKLDDEFLVNLALITELDVKNDED